MIALSTERLQIRNFRPEDWRALYAYLSVPEVMRFEPGGVSSEDDCRRIATERAANDNFLAVCRTAGNELIGHVYFAPYQQPELRCWMLGYIFNPHFGAQGYATEACTAIVQQGFAGHGVRRVIALCNPENVRSWRLLERIGMRREGHFIRDIFFRTGSDGKPVWQDTYQYAILAEEA